MIAGGMTLTQLAQPTQLTLAEHVPGALELLRQMRSACPAPGSPYAEDFLAAAVARYLRLLKLLQDHPMEPLVPTLEVDWVWRAHMAHPMDYSRFLTMTVTYASLHGLYPPPLIPWTTPGSPFSSLAR